MTKGFWNALKDLGAKEAWIIAPVKESYPIEKNVQVAKLEDFLKTIAGESGNCLPINLKG